MSDDRSQMMFDILFGIQADLRLIKWEQASRGIGLSSIEDHVRGVMTSIYGMQSDVANLDARGSDRAAAGAERGGALS